MDLHAFYEGVNCITMETCLCRDGDHNRHAANLLQAERRLHVRILSHDLGDIRRASVSQSEEAFSSVCTPQALKPASD